MKKRSFLLVFTICAILLLSCSGVMAAGEPMPFFSINQNDRSVVLTTDTQTYVNLNNSYNLDEWKKPVRLYNVEVPKGTTQVYFRGVEAGDLLMPITDPGTSNESFDDFGKDWVSNGGQCTVNFAANQYYLAFEGVKFDPYCIFRFVEGDAIGTVTVSVEKFTLGQGYLLEPVIVPLYENETAADVIVRVMGKENCNYNSVGFYLRSIKDEDTSTPDFPQYILKEVANRTDDTEESLLAAGRVNEGWLGEFDYYNTSGWIYWVNHIHANVGADQWPMKDGDVMRWQFTVVALGGDLGDTGYDNLIDSANKDALTKKIAEINRDKNAYLNGDATKQRYYDNAMKILTTMTATQEQVDMALANLNGTSTEEPTLPDPDALDEEVENVEALIAAIGDVTKDSGAAIEAATAAYDALPTRKQGRVHNYNVLKRAITKYEKILAEAEKPVDPVKPVDPPAAQYPGADTMKDMTNKAAWYYNAVDWAMKVGFFGGDDKGNFNPDQYITRAEFAQMLYNYYKDDATVMKDGTAPKFNDVKGDDWYYRAVKACAKAGIFKGDDKGNFNPNAPITRQDTALVLMRIFIGEDAIAAVDVDARLAELKAEGKDLADFRQTADYAQKAMAAAIGLIFNGDDKGMLHPTNNITRAETATVLQNYFQ